MKEHLYSDDTPAHPWITYKGREVKKYRTEIAPRPELVDVRLIRGLGENQGQVRIECVVAILGGTYSKYTWDLAASPWYANPADAFAALATELREGRLILWDLVKDQKKDA